MLGVRRSNMSWGYGPASLEVGDKIRLLLKSRNVTEEDLAAAIGVTIQTVKRWISHASDPDVPLINMIAQFFNVTADYLLEISDDNYLKCSEYIKQRVDLFEFDNEDEMDDFLKSYRFPGINCKVRRGKKKLENGRMQLQIVSEF